MRGLALCRIYGTAWLTTFVAAAVLAQAAEPQHTFAIGDKDFLLDGKPFAIRSGESHYTRIPREYWPHRLRMAKALGLNTVSTYVFWNLHEPQPGRFDFTGNADVAEFCRVAQREGLYVIVRPGPRNFGMYPPLGFRGRFFKKLWRSGGLAPLRGLARRRTRRHLPCPPDFPCLLRPICQRASSRRRRFDTRLSRCETTAPRAGLLPGRDSVRGPEL